MQIVDEHRLLGFDRHADQPHAGPETNGTFGRRIADRVGDAQFASALVEQIDGERFERDQPPDQPRDLVQQVVEVEHGGDLTAQIEERRDEFLLGPWVALRMLIRRGFIGWK